MRREGEDAEKERSLWESGMGEKATRFGARDE